MLCNIASVLFLFSMSLVDQSVYIIVARILFTHVLLSVLFKFLIYISGAVIVQFFTVSFSFYTLSSFDFYSVLQLVVLMSTTSSGRMSSIDLFKMIR